MRIILIRHEKQPPRREVRCLARKYLVGTEEDIAHGHLFLTRHKQLFRYLFVVDQITQSFHIDGGRHFEFGEEVAIWVGRRATVAELGLFGAEEEDAHHVVWVGDDALLHELVGAF
jgi:hypothetical protein